MPFIFPAMGNCAWITCEGGERDGQIVGETAQRSRIRSEGAPFSSAYLSLGPGEARRKCPWRAGRPRRSLGLGREKSPGRSLCWVTVGVDDEVGIVYRRRGKAPRLLQVGRKKSETLGRKCWRKSRSENVQLGKVGGKKGQRSGRSLHLPPQKVELSYLSIYLSIYPIFLAHQKVGLSGGRESCNL